MQALVPIEQSLVKYLGDAVGVPVGTKIPTSRPASFIRLSRTGGGPTNLAQTNPTVLIECWASSDTAAFALAAASWSLLRDTMFGQQLPLDVFVMAVPYLQEPVNYPDAATGSPRYQFIYSPIVNLQETS